MKKNRYKRLRRVDSQVSIITASIVIASFICVYFFNYSITHEDMIYNLKERCNSIYEYIEDSVDKTAFENVEQTSVDSDSYTAVKSKLESVRQATNVMYLYTATKDKDGNFIYLVDGLPSDSSDFRNPGDLIEEEIIPEMKRAMNDEVVMPDKIKETTWGEIFVAYYPIHNNGEVVGVIGMEFDASHQFKAFRLVRFGTPLIAIFACMIAIVVAVFLFRRISNPLYKDLSNIDYLTNVKSRNAFELDLQNLKLVQDQIGFIVADLNGLKAINDSLGHQVGDEYIVHTASLLMEAARHHPVYRFGGDEFVIICVDTTESELQDICHIIKDKEQAENEAYHMQISISYGYALFDESLDKDLDNTIKRADGMMYQEKYKRKG